MISIVLSSKSNNLLQQIKSNISHTIGVEHEIIVIENSGGEMGIAKAYNLGAAAAQYSIICFCHEDILFHTNSWGNNVVKHLNDSTISLLGVLGNSLKTQMPSGVYSNIQELNRVNQLQRFADNSLKRYYNNPYNEPHSKVSILDGLFLCCRKDDWKKTPFDEQGLKRFHGYDVDFSLSQQANGDVVVVYDIDIEHLSFGGNSKDWIDAQFFVSAKWKHTLPNIKDPSISKKLLAEAEVESQNQLLLSLYRNKYSFKTARRLTRNFLLRRPVHRNNWFFIKRYFKSLL